MRYEYIEPLIDSTIKVLDAAIRCDIVKGDVSLVRPDHLDGDISVVLGLSGDSKGDIIVNMETETALKVSGAMNSGNFEYLTPLAMDSISELANMIAGNTMSALNDLGCDFRVSPPLILKQDSLMKKTSGLEILQVPLFTEYGEITVNVALGTQ